MGFPGGRIAVPVQELSVESKGNRVVGCVPHRSGEKVPRSGGFAHLFEGPNLRSQVLSAQVPEHSYDKPCDQQPHRFAVPQTKIEFEDRTQQT